jgi:CRISPR-associated endoribonuclease Cas6
LSNFAIKVGRFEFTIQAKSPIILNAYPGSTLRGAFGTALKKVVCALRNKECIDCMLREQCVYSYVFETPPKPGTKVMKRYDQVPRPFVLEPPLDRKIEYKPGEELTFGLTLIGDKAIECCPYFIYAFDALGNIGIGEGRGKFELKTVYYIKNSNGQENNNCGPSATAEVVRETVYSSETKKFKPVDGAGVAIDPEGLCSDGSKPCSLTLNFITPTRIYYNGSLTTEPEFHILMRNLQRRVAHLFNFHCGIDTTRWDFFNKVIYRAKKIQIKKQDIKWYFWERYSKRQEAWIEMSGFVGKVQYYGRTDSFLPLLQAGEILHIGKGTTFGLGRYYIE